ncbi:NAD(P)-dependent oxidoreductase [Ruegeria sp. SCPT10]|uniref:NAD-dependent epimerase/dehydratase family protein n=1 Tax=Ruegeria sp. SCP10 TaxID=3141377 RepID=UPI00333D0273
MKRICVTGGSGGAGDAVIQDLLIKGYECANLDIKSPREKRCQFIETDMCDYPAVFAGMESCDALVHFAGNPHPDDDHWGAADRSANNTVSLFNAFNAAQAHGIKRVVWASSETIFGFPFETNRPPHIPLDELDPPNPQNGYAISKAISENIAELMAKLYGMTFVGLRLSNVLYDDVEAIPSFQKIPGYWDDVGHRKFNLWGYIDSRDVARAVRLSLETPLKGAHVFSIAAKDTLMKQSTRELVDTVMPGVEVRAGIRGRDAMLNCSKAKVMLGFEPEFTWQNVLGLNEDEIEVAS